MRKICDILSLSSFMKEGIPIKTALRKHYKQIRHQIPPQEKSRQSEAAIIHLINSSLWQNHQHILLYLALEDELSLDLLFTHGWQKKKTLYIPISIVKDHSLLISRLDNFSDLTLGAYGIRELPSTRYQLVDPHLLELILIPGIAFDLFGNRIGFGAGYYDRFLPQLKPSIPKIGAAFQEQISETPLPTNRHDTAMDYILTSSGLYNVFS